MKKSLARVKQQLADQLRPGKTETLSEELQAADKRVDYLREALQTLGKALPLPPNTDKRLKKGPDYAVYNLLKNEKLLSNEDGAGELVQPILVKYAEMFYMLADEMSIYEQEVDKSVSTPLHKLLETDISKLKKNLTKHINDRESASNRLQTAQSRQSETNTKHHVDPSKLSSLQDDVEEAGQRVEQASDQLAHDMFTLLSKEPEIASYILLHIKLRRQYYENALDILNRLIPDVETLINNSEVRPVFNCPLADHLRVTKRKIALPIELCVCAVMEHGIAEEGLFRVAGGASKLRRLKLSVDANCLTLPLPSEYKDIHLFAGVLKSYLRELPEPLLTYSLYEDWMRAGRVMQEEQRVVAIKEILTKLPKENFDNLRYLAKFLSQLSKNQTNKMSSHNIAIVMSPNLLWGRSEPDLDELGFTSRAVDTLVSHADTLFPGDEEFYLNYKPGEIFRNENIVSRHTRNNSNDTNIFFNEHENHYSTSENSSPKPVTRRKNKPAPEPPKNFDIDKNRQNISGTATINRTTYKSANKNFQIDNKMSQNTNEIVDNDIELIHARRKSLDFENANLQIISKPNVTNKKEHIHILSKNDISEPTLISNTVTTPVKDLNERPFEIPSNSNVIIPVSCSVQTANVNQITAQTVSAAKITVTSDNLQQKCTVPKPSVRPPPIAAPRPSIESKLNKSSNAMTKSVNDIDFGETDIELRRQQFSKDDSVNNRTNKPTVPERPPSLRPASFRLNRNATVDTADSSCDPALLERAVVYNTSDKQQVSIVQFKDKEKLPPGHDNHITEKEKFLGLQPTPISQFTSQTYQPENSVTSNPSESNCDFDLDNQDSMLQRRKSLGAKPARPPKPDITKSNERLNMFRSNERLNMDISPVADNTEVVEKTASKSNHNRTLSDGNVIDMTLNSTSDSITQTPVSPLAPGSGLCRPPSPRGPSRPPRPQPPPPPPPNIAKRLSDSTDL